MKRIAIDMDEVIADAMTALLGKYNAEFGEALTAGDLAGGEIRDALHPERRDRITAYLIEENFFRKLEVMPNSQNVIFKLNEKFEVFITTAAMEFPTSFGQKYEWLQEHFPFIPDSRIVFCGDKSIIQADYLIDDRPRHFQRFIGQGVLFTAPHNIYEAGYPRVNNWLEVEAMFLDDQAFILG